MKVKVHTTVEMEEDGLFSARIFETDDTLVGFRITYRPEKGGDTWWEMTRAELVGLMNFLGEVLTEADNVEDLPPAD